MILFETIKKLFSNMSADLIEDKNLITTLSKNEEEITEAVRISLKSKINFFELRFYF